MKDTLKNNWLGVALLVLVVIWLGIYGVHNYQPNTAVKGEATDSSSLGVAVLAQCLTDQGFKLYGASWCGHCQEQKEMFGEAVALINYVECSTDDGNDQTEVCTQAGIEMYPTWEYPDGNKVPGVMTLEELAKVSGCPAI
ncbi:MAG: thioredoxin domain-containing protein [Patescibacteria group bacterium]